MKFNNFIRFVSVEELDSTPAESLNWNAPERRLDTIPAQNGDFFRFLIPKSDVSTSESVENLKLCLERATAYGYERISDIGTIRRQDSENYTQLKIAVLSAPQDEYRQFALTRSTGETVFGTFTEQSTDLDSYTTALKNHLESYPFANVFVDKNGGILTIKAYTSEYFHLNDEPLFIGIGDVDSYNTNNPSIIPTKISSATKPAQDTYKLFVSNVSEGNIFTINSDSYTATASDTVETVLSYFLKNNSRLSFEKDATVSVSAKNGFVTYKNLIKPTIEYIYDHSDSTYDYWRILVTGSLIAGNYLEVSTPSAKSKITISDIDTLETATSSLNPNSGFFRCLLGEQITLTVIAGQRIIENANFPQIAIIDKITTPAESVDRHLIVISSDIIEGNEYFYQDKKYIASLGDTPNTIATSLGLSQNAQIVELPSSTSLTYYAKSGKKYSGRHVSNVKIIEQPTIKKSTQYVCECSLGDEIEIGHYHLSICNQTTNQLYCISNPIYIRPIHQNTSIVEVSGSTEYDYEYHEDLLTQRLRLPLYARAPKNTINSTQGMTLLNLPTKMNTTISQIRELITVPLRQESRAALAMYLQHRTLYINSQSYIQSGSYDEILISEQQNTAQIFATVQHLDQKSNYPSFFSSTPNFMFATCSLRGLGVEIFLQNKSYIRKLSPEQTLSIPTSEYEIHFVTGPDDKLLKLYQNGTLQASVILQKNRRSKLIDILRINSGDKLIFNIDFLVNLLPITFEPKPQMDYRDADFVPETKDNLLDSFNNDFDDSFQPDGQNPEGDGEFSPSEFSDDYL